MERKYLDIYIGDVFYKERVVRRWTQEDLLKLINEKVELIGEQKIARSTYANYERGDRSMPHYVFVAGCELFGLNDVEVFEAAQKYELDAYIKGHNNASI